MGDETQTAAVADPSATGKGAIARRAKRLDAAIEEFAEATPLGLEKARHAVQTAATALLGSDDGMQILRDRAADIARTPFFEDTPWADPTLLRPRLVAGGLLGDPPHPVMEVLSQLRMVAIATGQVDDDRMGPDDALQYLERIIALNLEFLFPRETEETRHRHPERFATSGRLFETILEAIPHADFLHLVIDEIEEVCQQRRIWTGPVRRMIRLASRLPGAEASDDERLERYVEAVLGPSPMSRRFRTAAEYHDAIRTVDADMIAQEAMDMARSLRNTGLACEQHAVLMRHIARKDPPRMADALGLDDTGRRELEKDLDLIIDLVRAAIHPDTTQTLYGLARALERGVLHWPGVAEHVRHLASLDLHADVAKTLRASRDTPRGASPNALLISGAIRILGQPLGVGQGRNPTCQAARGISLWAQHRPDYLLELLMSAATDNDVHMYFGDQVLHSKDLPPGLAWSIDPGLDPVSLVLVPHLDRLYDEMMRRVAPVGGDGHRWVNPGLYGRTVPNGFATCFDAATWSVTDHADFIRRFFATHHPDYRIRPLVYPNPVGILVTTSRADLLGLHAVTIQRVEPDPLGETRVYFYNPNDEGRQDWGQGIKPSVHGFAEEEGESSLPFDQFASRLYAFHYNPFEEGEAYAVPETRLKAIGELAKSSWGRQYLWA